MKRGRASEADFHG